MIRSMLRLKRVTTGTRKTERRERLPNNQQAAIRYLAPSLVLKLLFRF